MLAAITQTPELVLDDADSAKLATALANVTRHMTLPALSPEKMALGVLVWTAGRIYGPRAMAIAARKRGVATTFARETNPTGQTNEPPQTVNPGNPGGSWFMPEPSMIQ